MNTRYGVFNKDKNDFLITVSQEGGFTKKLWLDDPSQALKFNTSKEAAECIQKLDAAHKNLVVASIHEFEDRFEVDVSGGRAFH